MLGLVQSGLSSPLLAAFDDPQAMALARQNARKPALYARLFDRFSPQATGYHYREDDKKALFRRGLLGFAAAASQPNGGNFANALANGLLMGSQTMDQGAQALPEADYQRQLRELKLAGGDAPSGYRQFELMAKAAGLKPGTPEYAKAAQIGLGMEGRASNAGISFDSMVGPDGRKRPTRMNPRTGAYEVWDENAQDFVPITGQQVASIEPPQTQIKPLQPMQDYGPTETDNYVRSILGKAGQIDPNAPPEQQAAQLLPHLIQQESGGNPNAISPKGAFGLTQAMPATARDPGFGVRPMQGNTPEEQVRFGRDYLTAMLKRYPGRPDLALAAYNSGPGNADRLVAGPAPRNLVVGRSPEEDARAKAQAEAEVKLATEQEIARRSALGGAQGKTQGDLEAMVTKRTQSANDALPMLDEAKMLIPLSTGSGVGTIYDKAAGFFGASNKGAQASAQLATIAGQLVAKMPRMEGPQSDRDVQMYKDMAGNLADPTIPRGQRLAALETIRKLQEKYASNQGQPTQPAGPIRIQSASDYEALPSGAEFIAPDGSRRRKR